MKTPVFVICWFFFILLDFFEWVSFNTNIWLFDSRSTTAVSICIVYLFNGRQNLWLFVAYVLWVIVIAVSKYTFRAQYLLVNLVPVLQLFHYSRFRKVSKISVIIYFKWKTMCDRFLVIFETKNYVEEAGDVMLILAPLMIEPLEDVILGSDT